MSNLLTRSISGLVFVAVVIFSIVSAWYVWAVLMLIVSFLGTLEFARLLKKSGMLVFPITAAACAPFFVAFVFLFLTFGSIHPLLWILIGLPLLLLILTSLIKPDGLRSFFPGLLAAGYVAFPISMTAILIWLPTRVAFTELGFDLFSAAYQPQLLLSVVILIWVFDTFAYLTGSRFGKHKMVPRISPEKSWEGFLGGLICMFPAVWILNWFWDLMNNHQWLGMVLIIAVFGIAGDLFISQLKRMAGEKNSGKLIPGHGGILDRFDSFLMVIPFVALYVMIIVL
ncbi:MAG: phosphatidate cytidylyltransferase [Bacteroidota bacterium]